MKRKLIVVFMTIVMAVSLAFGMSIMTVGAADELTLGDVSTTYTSGTAIEISCSQFTTGDDEQELGGNSLTYVTVTSGGSTYNASNVRQIVSRKSLRVYFNGTGYSFSNAKKGDLFTVKQGMTSTKYPDLTVSEDINYIYTGISWIKGNEVPSNVEIIWPESFGTNDWGSMVTQLNLPTSSHIFNGGDLNPTAENLAKIRITRGETKFAASNVYGWNGKLTLYFNNTGYDGTNAQKDDVLTIDAGFTLTIDGTNYVSTKAKSYTFTGTQWVDTAEVPAEKTELTVSTLSLSSVQGKKDALLYLTTGSDNTADLGDANQSFCLNFVELNFADGTKGDVWYARICKNEVRFFVHNKNGSGNMNTSGLTRGDKFVVKTGFAYSATATSEVKADKNYIYDGSAWIEGTELPADQELTIGDIDPFYVSGTQVEMGCEMFTGADEAADLTVENGTNIVITDVDGNTYTPSNIRQVPSRKHFKLYFNGKGYSFDSAKRGDKLVIGEGFAIRGNYSYVVSSDITFIYTGTTWIKAETLPAEKSELKVGSITAGVGVSGAYPKDALIYVNTDSTNAADNGMNDVAELRRFVRYTFNGTPAVIGNVWFARLYKGEARFFVRQKTNGAANMAVSDIAKGDKFTVKKGFSIGNAEVKADVSYIFNGNVWVNAEDYIDYDKLTKNGIDTKEKELTLYKGDEFVLPELFYTYTTEVKVPETVDADDVTIENAPDMNTVNENGYRVTLKVGDFSVNITVKVLDTTELNVTNVGVDLNWNKIAVETDTANQKSDINAHTEYLRYFEYDRDGVKLTVSGYIIYGNKYEIDVKDTDGNWMVRDKVAYCKVGDKFTVKKGLPFINGERLTETVTYVYNGTKFVKLVEPETFDVDATMSVFVNGVKQINVKDDVAVTAVYKYASSDDTVATVSETGVVKGIKVGTAKITVSYKDVSKEITVTVSEEPAKKGIEIVSDIEIFYVPVATATADNNFTSMGYTLLARYLYVDGSVGDVFDVEASQIGDINYTVAGLKDLTITIGEFTATVKVNVYEYKNVTSFTSLGVSGYDVNDDRNQPGTWNGHMIIGMNSISTSKGNMLSTESSEKMSEYIVYETAEGNKYYGKADKDNDIIDRIGVWQLGTNLLIMIKPEGSNANVGYGSEDHWKSDASYGYVPVYKAGDKITFLAGMPIYAWKGSLGENNYPAEGKGCLIVEGYVTEDIVYYCYEEDGVKSLWQIYKEYTDFTVNPSVTLTVGGTGSIGAVKTPIDATTGKFTYESSDPAVVTVTKDGNLAGLGIGTATVTVTLTGGKDADGNALDPIVKTVTVTVKKGIKSVSGEITVTKGATIDLADYEITVRYTDGTEENISLGANNVIVEDIDTSVTGTTEYGVRVTIDGETKRGTLTVTVKAAKKGCKGDVVSVSSILGLAFVTAGVIIVRKKSKKA